MWKVVLSYTSSRVLLMPFHLWALSLLLICLMHHILVGLTRKHLILATLSLGHCAMGSRWEQNLVFEICCDEWLLFAPATDQGPRLSADTVAGGSDTHLGSEEQCQTRNSHGRRMGPSPFTSMVIYFCSNNSCPNEGLSFNPKSWTKYKRMDGGFVIHCDSVFRNISHMKEKSRSKIKRGKRLEKLRNKPAD